MRTSKPLAVVTGGTKGIGRAIAERLVAEGFEVVVSARTVANANALGFIPVAADLSTRSGVEVLIQAIRALNRPVEVLVNNAGVFLPGQIQNEADGTFEHLMATNVASAYHLTRALLPDMIARKQGHIFMMCSTASITPYINGGSYCISKFALLGMSRVLREELKPHHIRVTALLPGATLTASWEGTDLPPDRFMAATDVADMVWAAYQLPIRAVVEEILLRPLEGDI